MCLIVLVNYLLNEVVIYFAVVANSVHFALWNVVFVCLEYYVCCMYLDDLSEKAVSVSLVNCLSSAILQFVYVLRCC